MGRVNSKVAIVTGGARGMGAAFARTLLAEGARVVITDILDAEGRATAQQLGGNAKFFRHDVTKEAEWQQIVAATEAAFGPVSVLVNNAGVSGFVTVETLDEAEYRRVIDVNQLSVFLGMKSVIASMKRADGGSIINMSSAAGLVGFANLISYTASKFAVRGMTKSAAIELAPYGIRVNSIHPSLIRTPLIAPNKDSEALLAGAIAATPLGRLGEPEEVANIVLLLASDESRFTTGAEFVIDGGFAAQ